MCIIVYIVFYWPNTTTYMGDVQCSEWVFWSQAVNLPSSPRHEVLPQLRSESTMVWLDQTEPFGVTAGPDGRDHQPDHHESWQTTTKPIKSQTELPPPCMVLSKIPHNALGKSKTTHSLINTLWRLKRLVNYGHLFKKTMAPHIQHVLMTRSPVNHSPEYVTEQQGSIIPECPVVIERVDGRC